MSGLGWIVLAVLWLFAVCGILIALDEDRPVLGAFCSSFVGSSVVVAVVKAVAS